MIKNKEIKKMREIISYIKGHQMIFQQKLYRPEGSDMIQCMEIKRTNKQKTQMNNKKKKITTKNTLPSNYSQLKER